MGNVSAVRLHIFQAAGTDGNLLRWHMTTDAPEVYAMYQSKEWEEIQENPVYVFNQPFVGSVKLLRYRNKVSGDHFFTTSEDEGNQAIVKYDCVPEGFCCYLSPEPMGNAVPFYRLLYWNTYHRYMIDADTRAVDMYNQIAVDEGIAGYVWAGPNLELPAA